MDRLIHETRDTFMTLLVVSCLAMGIFAAVYYAVGPSGWLSSMLKDLLVNPNLRTLFALAGIMGVLTICKRWLERNPRSLFNNLLVGVVGLGGFVVLLQGLRAFVA